MDLKDAKDVKIEERWKEVLEEEFNKDYMLKLKDFLKRELEEQKVIYPHGRDIFSAFNFTPFDKVRVVIIGQDPYHGPGQAHGLCFSVRPEVPPPPSLLNIFKELQSDLGIVVPDKYGSLVEWAKQGVLLLNAVLTVEKNKPLSHNGQGWEIFTDRVVEILNEEKQNLVFVLWGSPAQKKGAKVDEKKHFVIKAPHPSPLSAYRGFFGHRPFSKINDHLRKIGNEEINWQL
ncbi:MAG: uracil-DNA glycosylase [Oligoflexia bacterium]|nr:uracil-DNA glycosylase [Oligoflexia bacterium]